MASATSQPEGRSSSGSINLTSAAPIRSSSLASLAIASRPGPSASGHRTTSRPDSASQSVRRTAPLPPSQLSTPTSSGQPRQRIGALLAFDDHHRNSTSVRVSTR